jgi:hypothetical protein
MKKNPGYQMWMAMVLLLIQAACIVNPSPTSTPSPTMEDQPTSIPLGDDIYMPAFASISVRLPESFPGGSYTLPLDTSVVAGMEDIELSEAQLALLSQNGFVVASPVTGKWQEFYQIYESGRYYGMPNFITTDSVYHVYHLLFDKMLRDLETTYFTSDLRSLTTAMLVATTNQWETTRQFPGRTRTS